MWLREATKKSRRHVYKCLPPVVDGNVYPWPATGWACLTPVGQPCGSITTLRDLRSIKETRERTSLGQHIHAMHCSHACWRADTAFSSVSNPGVYVPRGILIHAQREGGHLAQHLAQHLPQPLLLEGIISSITRAVHIPIYAHIQQKASVKEIAWMHNWS